MFNLFRHENWLKKLRRIGDREKNVYLLEGRGDGFKGGYKPQKCKDMEIQIFEGILISSGEPFYSTDIHGEDLDSPLIFFPKTVGGKSGFYNTNTGIESLSQSKYFEKLWPTTHAFTTML